MSISAKSMGHLTISLDRDTEAKLRRLASERHRGKKGSISKVISEALEKLDAENQRQRAIAELKALMNQDLILGPNLIKHRSELYDRK